MTAAAPEVVQSIADYQLLPRGEDGTADAVFVLDDGRSVTITLPTGGPYDVPVTVDGEVVHRVVGVVVGDIWVLAGQSNMAGGGVPDGLPTPTSPQAVMLSLDGVWKPAVDPVHRVFETGTTTQALLIPDVDPTRTAEDVAATYEDLERLGHTAFSGGIGCGTFFAEELLRLTGVPVGLLPCAMGASPLSMWEPGWRSPRGIDANLYDTMIERARRYGPVRGVLWYQGESDTAPDLAATYLDRFTAFVQSVRADLAQPDLPFVTVQLGRTSTWPEFLEPEWARVREAQRLAAESIPNVSVVAGADLSLLDGLHVDTAGFRVLGPRLARAASGLYTTPGLKAVEADGDQLILRFDGVNGRLTMPPDAAASFASDAPVLDVLLVGDDVVVVTTAGPAAWIGYCLGYGDVTAIVDEAGLPVPAFGPIDVPR